MTFTDSCFSSCPLRCRRFRTDRAILAFVTLVLVVASTNIAVATSDKLSATGSERCRNGTNRRWVLGTAHPNIHREDNGFSSSWREIAKPNNENSADIASRGSILLKHMMKNRLGLFHFGKINQLSKFEGYKKKKTNENLDDTEEHPLRTNIWELDLKWSFLSKKSKMLSPSNEASANRKEGNMQLELDPEGYCRIYENTETFHSKDEASTDSTVLAIGRWKKRPWGVTIVVRPVSMPKSSTSASSHGAASRIDDQNEFVFHANNFHWNGFGTNPKLTQGTILFQKQKKSEKSCWWKSTTLARSSILPIWPEEMLSCEDGSDKLVGGNIAHFGAVHSNLLRLSGILQIATRKNRSSTARPQWFRPVVGTFTAKGIIMEK